MDRILIPWSDGNGNIVISKGEGGDFVSVSSDTPNNGKDVRKQIITFRTLKGDKSVKLTVVQDIRGNDFNNDFNVDFRF